MTPYEIIRGKCASEELAQELLDLLQKHFWKDWAVVVDSLAEGEICSKEQIDQLFHDNW